MLNNEGRMGKYKIFFYTFSKRMSVKFDNNFIRAIGKEKQLINKVLKMDNMEKDYKTILLFILAMLALLFLGATMAFLELTFHQKERVVSCVNSAECVEYIKNSKKIPTEELLEYFNVENK